MNSINGLLVAVLAGLSILPGCGDKVKEQPVKKTGLVVINVLDEDTYSDCHIAGSINVPFESLETCFDAIDKEAEVVVYCSNPMCSSSEYAAIQFQKAGFAHVSVYEGGTAEWYQKGLPVEGPSTSDYLRQQVQSIACDAHACMMVTAEQLAQKMGLEIPSALQSVEPSVAEQVATAIEIPAVK